MDIAEKTDEHLVHEVIGPSLHPREAAAAIGMGVVSLLVAGVLPVLLGSLADEHRLSAAGIGLAAMSEALCMGITAGLMGMLPRAENLRRIAVAAALAAAAIDLANTQAGMGLVIPLRGLAGIPEGVLLWITVGMIARSETPERWAGVFFTTLVSAQLVLALSFDWVILPRYGANGGLVVVALCFVPALFLATALPNRYAPLVRPPGEGGAPPPRGWVALLATLIYVSSMAAVGIYLQPLAYEAGLTAEVARTAIWTSLIAQILGGAAAALLAGRLHYMGAFLFATLILFGTWATFAFHVPAWAFIAANAAGGFASIFLGPFLVPMTIEADPTRRTAMQSAGAQLISGALGPALASQFVGENHSHGALLLGFILSTVGLSIIAGLHLAARREAIRISAASD